MLFGTKVNSRASICLESAVLCDSQSLHGEMEGGGGMKGCTGVNWCQGLANDTRVLGLKNISGVCL